MVGFKNNFLPTLDFDKKTFTLKEWEIFQKTVFLPLIYQARNSLVWGEKTLNGGYHLVFKSKEALDSIQHSLWWNGKSRGQLQWKNKYTVLGISQGYEMFKPKLFLYENGQLKRKPNLEKLVDPQPINQIFLTILLSQFRINLNPPKFSKQPHPFFSKPPHQPN